MQTLKNKQTFVGSDCIRLFHLFFYYRGLQMQSTYYIRFGFEKNEQHLSQEFLIRIENHNLLNTRDQENDLGVWSPIMIIQTSRLVVVRVEALKFPFFLSTTSISLMTPREDAYDRGWWYLYLNYYYVCMIVWLFLFLHIGFYKIGITNC